MKKIMKYEIRTGLAWLGMTLLVLSCVGQVFAEDTSIEACVQKKTGVVRVVASPADCASNESSLQWNSSGPQGVQGEPGVAEGIRAAYGIWVNPDGTEQYATHPGATIIRTKPGFYNVRLPIDLIWNWSECTVSPYDNAGPPNRTCSINGTAKVLNTEISRYWTTMNINCTDSSNTLADGAFHMICFE